MAYTSISLRDFLKSGRFGPIGPESCLSNVAKDFGGPTDFLIGNEEFIPTYWRYENFEISFDEHPPHKTRFYQMMLHSAGDFVAINDRIAVSLEGLRYDTRPSEFLKCDFWELDAGLVRFGVRDEYIAIKICAGVVDVIFEANCKLPEEETIESYVSSASFSDLIRGIESKATVETIQVNLDASGPSRFGGSFHRFLSARDYLAFADETP